MKVPQLYELLAAPLYRNLLEKPPLDNLLFLELTGSAAYGTYQAGSDIDLRGVLMPPLQDLLSAHLSCPLTNPRLKWGPAGMESFVDDETDTVIYSLAKFFQLLAKGSPAMIELLYGQPNHIYQVSPTAAKLFQNRDLFVTQRLYLAISGYIKKHLVYLDDPQTERKVLKIWLHMIRLLDLADQLAQTGTYLGPATAKVQELRAILDGQISAAQLKPVINAGLERLPRYADEAPQLDQARRQKMDQLYFEIVTSYYSIG